MANWDVFHSSRLEVERGLTSAQIRASLASGELQDDDLVRPAGTTVPWARILEMPALFQDEAVPAPTPPPAPAPTPVPPAAKAPPEPPVPPPPPAGPPAEPDLRLKPHAPGSDIDQEQEFAVFDGYDDLRSMVDDRAAIAPEDAFSVDDDEEEEEEERLTAFIVDDDEEEEEEEEAEEEEDEDQADLDLDPAIAGDVGRLDLDFHDDSESASQLALPVVMDDEYDPQEEDEAAAEFTLSRSGPEKVEELDLAAMVDVAFQLVLFFLVTATTVLYKSLEVPKPNPEQNAPEKAAQGKSKNLDDLKDDFILVEIDSAGAMKIDREAVAANMNAIVERLRSAREKTGRKAMLLSADYNTQHKNAVLAYDAANEIGLGIAIARPMPPSGGSSAPAPAAAPPSAAPRAASPPPARPAAPASTGETPF